MLLLLSLSCEGKNKAEYLHFNEKNENKYDVDR